jgi:hypothetical protein
LREAGKEREGTTAANLEVARMQAGAAKSAAASRAFYDSLARQEAATHNRATEGNAAERNRLLAEKKAGGGAGDKLYLYGEGWARRGADGLLYQVKTPADIEAAALKEAGEKPSGLFATDKDKTEWEAKKAETARRLTLAEQNAGFAQHVAQKPVKEASPTAMAFLKANPSTIDDFVAHYGYRPQGY